MKSIERPSGSRWIPLHLSLLALAAALGLLVVLEARSDETEGATVSGDTVSGATVSGDTVSGDTVSGDTVSGDTVSGDTGSGDTSESQRASGLPLTEEALEAKPPRLARLAWRLWIIAQNLHREARVIEPAFFDEVIEAFSRLGVTTDPGTGEQLVYVTGALGYIPASVLDENPDRFKFADPATPLRIAPDELLDPERIAEARRAADAAATVAPEGALRTELSPAAKERLVELLVFFERVLVRQAEWLALQDGKQVISADELSTASRLLIYFTGVDGWSSGYGYLRRAHAVTLNYVYYKIDILARQHGRLDDQGRRQLENEIAGLELEDGASTRLNERVHDLVRDRWRAAQREVSTAERVFVTAAEVSAAVQAVLPSTVDSVGTVTFFPGSERERVVEDFDLEATRESTLDWQVLAALLWENGAWEDGTGENGPRKTAPTNHGAAGGGGRRDLLPLDLYATDRLSELATHYTVLLLGTAGEGAIAAGEERLSATRLEAAHQELLPDGDGPLDSEAGRAAGTDQGSTDQPSTDQSNSEMAWDGPIPIFTEVAAEVGIFPIAAPLVTDEPGHKGPSMMSHDAFRGAATADFDRDGRPDLFLAEERGKSYLYSNTGDGRFRDVTAAAGLSGLQRVSGGYFADYDNDGCVDLLILRNYLSSLLFHNGCDGTFEDVTHKVGLYREGVPTTGAVWLDADNDGDLDLYLLLTGHFDKGFVPSRGDFQNAEANLLYRNRGDGTFEDVTAEAGVGDRGLALAAAAFDFDNDGDQDLYIANDMQRNVLYENLGGGRFRDVASQAGVDDLGNGMGVSIGDVDADGWMDIYLTNIGARPRARSPKAPQSNRLFLNRGDGSFEDVHTARVGQHLTGWGWNSFFFDFDNDTHLDIYVINGFRPEFFPHNAQRNFLFHAQGTGGSYQNVSPISGVDFEGYSRGGVFLDHDADGDLDVVLTGLHSPLFFRNHSEARGHTWIRLGLVGRSSNRDGFGARVKVVSGDRVQVAEMGNQGGGFISSIHGPLHFGLGTAQRADLVEVRWPSGIVQTLTDLEAGQVHGITEPKSDSEP